MFGLKIGEIIFIVLIIVLLFGATRLPQLARSIGASKRAFKEGLGDDDDEPVPTKAPPQQLRTAHSDADLEAELARRKASRPASN
ncbi:MAG: twin-arginine translocase TatA/TatE family subunit [Acidobacteria bacterium]|nr:twin-arginine translocase TatA/TatE family subunit [Acidobacteriota bacterium]